LPWRIFIKFNAAIVHIKEDSANDRLKHTAIESDPGQRRLPVTDVAHNSGGIVEVTRNEVGIFSVYRKELFDFKEAEHVLVVRQRPEVGYETFLVVLCFGEKA
jgi:hypothetical protein